jgi:hypothetical protein
MMLTFRQMPNGEQKPDDVEQIEPCSALALLQNSDGQRLMKSNSRYQASHLNCLPPEIDRPPAAGFREDPTLQNPKDSQSGKRAASIRKFPSRALTAALRGGPSSSARQLVLSLIAGFQVVRQMNGVSARPGPSRRRS